MNYREYMCERTLKLARMKCEREEYEHKAKRDVCTAEQGYCYCPICMRTWDITALPRTAYMAV